MVTAKVIIVFTSVFLFVGMFLFGCGYNYLKKGSIIAGIFLIMFSTVLFFCIFCMLMSYLSLW